MTALRRIRATLIAVTVIAAVSAAGSADALASAGPTPRAAVSSLNKLRASVGVRPVTYDDAQSQRCRKHAGYYELTGHIGHDEIPGDPGYTSGGDQAARTSNLAYGDTPFVGVADWTEAVYHRIALLDPRLRSSGYWAEHGIACMGVLGPVSGPTVTSTTAYPYPADGQQEVPLSFACNERPSPCTAIAGGSASNPIGSVLSVLFDTPHDHVESSEIATAALTPDGGSPVVIAVQDANTRATSAYMHGGFALIPASPLVAGTWYSAQVSGVLTSSDDGAGLVQEPFTVRWRFRTAPGREVVAASLAPLAKRCKPAKTATAKKRVKATKAKASRKHSSGKSTRKSTGKRVKNTQTHRTCRMVQLKPG